MGPRRDEAHAARCGGTSQPRARRHKLNVNPPANPAKAGDAKLPAYRLLPAGQGSGAASLIPTGWPRSEALMRKTPICLATGALAALLMHPLIALAAPALLEPEPAAEALAHAQRWDGGSDRLIVKYRSNQARDGVRAFLARQVAANRQGVNLEALRQTASGAQVYRLPRSLARHELMAMAQSLRDGDPDIEYVEPDLRMHAAFVPNDPQLTQQWHLQHATGGIRAPAAWDKARGAGVTIAVIDTGVRTHADLKAQLLPGYDFITDSRIAGDGNGRDADALDVGDFTTANECGPGKAAESSSWHGTHVAGIAAASGHNALGVSGVAMAAKILPVRVLGRCGGYSSDIADAIVWAAGGSVAGVPANPNPARVLNLSLGGPGSCGITTQNAINAARAKGALVVVAAGNERADAAQFSPANCSGVVVVAATNQAGAKASYSNGGTVVSLAAPGGDTGAAILSTYNSGKTTAAVDSYAGLVGTSMATPVVSGVAALMLSANSKLTPDQLTQLLRRSARSFPGSCSGCGAGLVDAEAAVNAALGAPPPSPSPAPTPAPAPAPTPTPAPAPSPGSAVAEREPNNTLAQAQVLGSGSVVVSGSTASTSDQDHYRVTVGAKRSLTATLSGASSAGFGLAALATSGQVLASLSAAPGQKLQLTLSNPGASPADLVLRVVRSSGAAGPYTLVLSQ